jgi:hypothetical protein
MKVKVPGAESSTGVKAVDFTLPKGDYVFEMAAAEIKESDKSPCVIHAFPMVAIDGPDDEKTGRTTQGRKFIRRIIQLLPEHDSYRKEDTRAADEIADLCSAADVEYGAQGYETEDFAGKKVGARLGIRMGKGEDGEPRPENTVLTQKTKDGALHMWLSDDGTPTSKKSTKAAPRATAGKRR